MQQVLNSSVRRGAIVGDAREPSLSLVGQSLIEAFVNGVTWTPEYYGAFLAARDQNLGGARYLQPDQIPETDAKTGQPQIDGELLYKILSRTIFEREGLDHWESDKETGRGNQEDFRGEINREIERINKYQPKAKLNFDRRGISASGLTVLGTLDARGLIQPIPIALTNCVFQGAILLDNAKLGSLDLSGSCFTYLRAGVAQIDGYLNLSKIPKTKFIYLIDAKIAGQLVCIGSTFDATGEKTDSGEAQEALNCSGAEIGGSVFLDEDFSATGDVSFVTARIGGQLLCSGGKLNGALNCNRTEIRNSVFLGGEAPDRGFSSSGPVSFVGAHIGGELRLYKVDVNDDLDLREASALTYADDESVRQKKKKGKLFLDGFTYERFSDMTDITQSGKPHITDIDWRSRKNWLKNQHQDDNFRPQPWLHCSHVLHEMGHDHDALRLAEAREWHKLGSDWKQLPLWKKAGALGLPALFVGVFLKWPFLVLVLIIAGISLAIEPIFLWLLWLLTGFGYSTWRATIWAAIFWLVGVAVYQNAYDNGVLIHDPNMNLNPASITMIAAAQHKERAEVQPGEDASYPAFNAYVYSLDTLLPIVNLRQREYWVPGDNAPSSNKVPPESTWVIGIRWGWNWILQQWQKPIDFRTFSLDETLKSVDIQFPDLMTDSRFVWYWTWFEIAMGWLLVTGFAARFAGLFERKE